jgi:hypothetical protein
LNSNCALQRALLPRVLKSLPLRGYSGSHHYLDYFREQKPVKTPAESLRDRMRQNR